MILFFISHILTFTSFVNISSSIVLNLFVRCNAPRDAVYTCSHIEFVIVFLNKLTEIKSMREQKREKSMMVFEYFH